MNIKEFYEGKEIAVLLSRNEIYTRQRNQQKNEFSPIEKGIVTKVGRNIVTVRLNNKNYTRQYSSKLEVDFYGIHAYGEKEDSPGGYLFESIESANNYMEARMICQSIDKIKFSEESFDLIKEIDSILQKKSKTYKRASKESVLW